MKQASDRISPRQLKALLLLYLFGTAADYLPGIAVSGGGRDGWLSVAIASVFAVVCVYLITHATAAFRGKGFHDGICALLSHPVGKLVCAVLAIKAVLSLALELRVFGEIVKTFLLPFTPFWLISAVMLALGGFAAARGFAVIGRTAELLVWAVFLPIAALLVLSAFDTDFTNLLPMLREQPASLLSGGFESGFAFSGIEMLLVLLPFAGASGGKARKSALSATVMIGALLTAITVLTIARFKPSGTLARTWPTLELLFSVNIPGAFMERQNALVLAAWILTVFAICAQGLFFGSFLLRDAVGRGKRGWYLPALIPAAFVLSLLPNSAERAVECVRALYRYTVPALGLALPFVLLFLARVRGEKP